MASLLSRVEKDAKEKYPKLAPPLRTTALNLLKRPELIFLARVDVSDKSGKFLPVAYSSEEEALKAALDEVLNMRSYRKVLER